MTLLPKRLMPLSTLLACAALWAVAAPVGRAAQTAPQPVQEVSVPGDVALRGYWFAGEGTQRRPAILALHGCGGLYAAKHPERLGERYREAVAQLNAAGYAVLLPDSLGSRGIHQICQTPLANRSVTVAQRVRDAEAALAWMARQPGVDATRIGVLGWSHGGSTALNLLAQRSLQAAATPSSPQPAIAAMAVFYPGCQSLAKRHADLGTVPLLLQIGALDDWTPAPPCEALVQQLRARPGTDVELHIYPDSYHGFDSKAPVRFRTDVPNGTSAQGVHQGGNPAARVQALAALDGFWTRVLKTPAAR